MDFMGTPSEENTDNGLHIESFKKEVARALTKITEREGEVVKLYF